MSKNYSNKNFFLKLFLFFYLKIIDFYKSFKEEKKFSEYGLTIYSGKQGSGKTVAMTEYLERMREKYPEAIIVTNYEYEHQDYAMTDWHDFFNIRNGTDGVIFAIDEIQNEFSSNDWRNFPESFLSEITQQRKQRIKIVATSQVFTRVTKQLREQTFQVVECFTLFGRWTFTKAYDAYEYNLAIDSLKQKKELVTIYKRSFIQDDHLRSLYDTYKKIDRLGQKEFPEKIKLEELS